MSLRSQLILIFALIAGVVFAIGFRTIFYTKPAPLSEEEQKLASEPKVPILVAKGNLAVGEELTAQNIRFQRFAESQVPWNAIFHFQDAIGRTLIKPVQNGRLISLFDLNDPDKEEKADVAFVPPGFQPVPVEIDSPLGPGDHAFAELKKILVPQQKIDIAVILEDKDAPLETDETRPQQRKLVTKPLCQEAEIYRLASTRKQVAGSAELEKIPVIYLLLNDEQAEQVKEAAKAGNILITIHQPNEEKALELEVRPAETLTQNELPPQENAASIDEAAEVSSTPAAATSETPAISAPVSPPSTEEKPADSAVETTPDSKTANFVFSRRDATDSVRLPVSAARKTVAVGD